MYPTNDFFFSFLLLPSKRPSATRGFLNGDDDDTRHLLAFLFKHPDHLSTFSCPYLASNPAFDGA